MNRPRGLPFFLILLLALGPSCGEEELTGPGDRLVEIAGKPSAPTGAPAVTGTVPNTAPQDTTLDVQVSGSGFDRGSRVDLALDGVVSPKVITNTTRFVNKSTLVANITIAVDAEPDLYDVLVTTTKGKRGIGIELFEISYAMTSLGTLPGHNASSAQSISENGDIMGGSVRAVGSYWDERIFIWHNGVMEEVGIGTFIAASQNRRIVAATPPSVWQEVGGTWYETLLPLRTTNPIHQAQSINPQGDVIVGTTGGESVAWREAAGTWSIEILPGRCPCNINKDGWIVGTDRVWTKESGTWTSHPLAPLPGGTNVLGSAINDFGDVVGSDRDGSGAQRAILWRKTPTGWAGPEYLGSLGGGSGATGINNAGYVVGYSEIPIQGLNHQHAFLWTPYDGMIDLGSRDKDSGAWDINDLGQIVGSSRKGSGSDHVAVLWEVN